MSNPLLGFIGNNMQNQSNGKMNQTQFIQQFDNFKKLFGGKNINPKTIVNQMIQSGKIDERTFEEAKKFANQFEQLFGK